MIVALDLVLGACLGVLAAAYVVWPLAVAIAARLAPPRPSEEGTPNVSLIVVARDERAAIADKLAACLALDYPAERLEILVASDGSTDGTVEEARCFTEVTVLDLPHFGKTAAAQAAATRARADILVFTDATTRLRPDALRRLAPALLAPDVGCATGRIVYTYDDAPLAVGFRSYQHVVVSQRQAEARAGTASVVSGALHAARRELLLLPVDPWQSYDLVLPLLAAERGLRAVYVADAVAVEASRRSLRSELRARVRIGVRCWLFLGLLAHRWRNVTSRSYLVQVLFHKVARWLGTIALLLLAILGPVGLTLGARLASAATGLVAVGVCLALIGLAAGALARRLPLLGLPLFFAVVNVAYWIALAQVVRGRRITGWQPER